MQAQPGWELAQPRWQRQPQPSPIPQGWQPMPTRGWEPAQPGWPPPAQPGGGWEPAQPRRPPPAQPGDCSDDSSDEFPATLQGNFLRFGLAVFVLLATAATLLTSWQQQVVMAKPSELYELLSLMSNMIPGEPVVAFPSKASPSEEPEPVFRISASLFYIHVSSLCDPISEAFDGIVHKKKCRSKLLAFCEDLRARSSIEKRAKKAYKKCMDAVNNKDGISIPLVVGPNEALWTTPESEREFEAKSPVSIEELEAELELELAMHDADFNIDFCETVVNCDELLKMQWWNYGLLLLMCLVLCVLLAAVGCTTASVVRPTSKSGRYGRCTLALALPLLLGAAALYVYIDRKFPVQDLVHTGALFFFVLPSSDMPKEDADSPAAASLAEVMAASLPAAGPGIAPRHGWAGVGQGTASMTVHSSGHFGRRSARRWNSVLRNLKAVATEANGAAALGSSLAMTHTKSGIAAHASRHSRIPKTRWHAALLKITETLLLGFVKGDMSDFFNLLGESLGNAWNIAKVVFDNWMRYLSSSILDGPATGKDLLDSLFLDSLDAGFAEFLQIEHFNEDHEQVQVEFTQLKKDAALTIEGVQGLMHRTFKVVRLVRTVWDEVEEPFTRTVGRVAKISTSKGDVAKIAMDMARDEDLAADLRLLFHRLFVGLPKVVSRVLKVARQLHDFAMGMKGFFERMIQVWTRARDLLKDVLKKKPELAARLAPIQKQLAATRTPLIESAVYWLNSSLSDAPEARSLALTSTSVLQGGPNFLTLVEPLVSGRLSGLASRVGMIFLHELEAMGSDSGLHVRKTSWAVCTPKMPSACTHFGTGFFGVCFLVVLVAIASLCFACGKW